MAVTWPQKTAAIFSVSLIYWSWSCGNYWLEHSCGEWTSLLFACFKFVFSPLPSVILRHENVSSVICFLLMLDFTRLRMKIVRGSLSTANDLQFLNYVILSRCDEQLERKAFKTTVKKSELCYFPLNKQTTTTTKNNTKTYMWLWIGWLSHLPQNVHVADPHLFRMKWSRWNILLSQFQMLHSLEDIAHVGLCSCHSKMQWRARLCPHPPPGQIAGCWTEAEGYFASGPEALTLGRSNKWKEWTHNCLCLEGSLTGTAWMQTANAQNVNFCAPQHLVPFISPHILSQNKHISDTPEDILCSLALWVFCVPISFFLLSLLCFCLYGSTLHGGHSLRPRFVKCYVRSTVCSA